MNYDFADGGGGAGELGGEDGALGGEAGEELGVGGVAFGEEVCGYLGMEF